MPWALGTYSRENAFSILSSVFFISNSTEFPGFNYHLQKKKNPKLYFQLSFLKNAAPFPTIPWTRCLGHPSPAIPPPPTHSRLKYTRSTGKSLSPHCSYPHTGSSFVTNYHSVYHHHHRHHPYPRRQAQNHGASSSHQLPWPVSTALPVPVIWAQPCLITC